MKKVLRLLALLLVVLLVFASCKNKKPTDEATDPVESQSEVESSDEGDEFVIDQEFVDKAAEMIYEFFKPGKDNLVSQDFPLPSTVKFQDQDVEIEWVVVKGEDVASIVEAESDKQILVVLNKDSEGGPFTVKAIVKCGGYEAEVEFEYVMVSQLEILKAAYALAPNESLSGTSTLTGVITKINTPYDESYGNITITIVCDEHDDMPIYCYRLKGDGVDKLRLGDTVTVSGTLTNYNGTIEFTSGCTLDRIDKESDLPEEPTYSTPQEIVNAAYALAAGDSLTKQYELVGTINKVNQPYDPAYENISVTIDVDGVPGKPIYCYRMKGAGADTLKKGDKIRVSGILTNYVDKNGKSTIEYTSGCKLLEILVSVQGKTYGSEAEIVDAAYALAANDSLDGEQTLTGVITKINTPYDTGYQNISVTIVVAGKTDKPIYCYRMKGDGADRIKVSDTIKVSGSLTNYVGSSGKSTIEFTSGCKLLQIVAVGDGTVPGGETETGTKITLNSVIPEAGKPYKLATAQQQVKKALYFNGSMDSQGKFLATVDKVADAKDVYLEAVEGGYALYFTDADNAKKYVTLTENGTDSKGYQKARISLGDTATTVFTVNTTYKTLYTAVNGTQMYLGTYGSYETFSASVAAYLEADGAYDVSQFPAVFVDSATATDVEQPGGDTPGGDTTPTKVYTVDEILAIMKDFENGQISTEQYTVKGTVSESSAKSKYNSYTIWLSSDDSETAKAFELYSVGIDASITDDYSAANSLVGKVVTCTGYVQKFFNSKTNETIFEMPYLSASNSPSQAAFTPTITKVAEPGEDDGVYTVDEILDLMKDFENGQISTEQYTVKGTVSESSAKSKYNSYTIWLSSDDGTTAKAFELYSVGIDASITDDYSAANSLVGKVVTCTGYVQKFFNSKTNETIFEMPYLSASNSPSQAAFTPTITKVEDAGQGGDQPGGDTPGGDTPGGDTPGGDVEPTDVYTVDGILEVMKDYTDKQISAEKYTVKGKVTSSSYNSSHSSYIIWLASDDGKTAQAFELYSVAMASTIEGDFSAVNALKGKLVTCTGYLQLYGTTKEMPYLKAGAMGEGSAEFTPTVSKVEDDPDAGEEQTPKKTYAIAETLTAGNTYKLGVAFPNSDPIFFDGTIASNYYLGLAEEGLDVTLESIGDGYGLSFMDGSNKKYVALSVNDTHVNAVMSDTAFAFSYNEDYKAFYAAAGTLGNYYIGGYGSNIRIQTSKESYYTADAVDKTNFPARLYEEQTVEEELPEGYVWTEVAWADITNDDVIAITMTKGEAVLALPNTTAADAPPAPVAVTVTSGKLVTEEWTNIAWMLEETEGGYKFNAYDTTNYLYFIDSKAQSLRSGTGANNVFVLDETFNYLKNVATNRYIGVFENATSGAQSWRGYTVNGTTMATNIANQTLKFWRLEPVVEEG